MIASKSRTDGPFAEMAADVLRQEIGEDGLERVARLNRDQVCSLVFEIEEPVRDPHIIKLDRPRAVLLACVRRSEHFEQASYKDLEKIAKWVGCDVKKVIANIPNARALASFNHRVENDPKWVFKGERLEGAVLEDQAGFSYKLKGHYYRNWKFVRSAVNEIKGAKEAGRAPRLERFAGLEEPFSSFVDWAKGLSAKALGSGVVALRDAFEQDRGLMEALEDEAPSAPPPNVARERFLAVIEQVVTSDRITEEGLARFLTTALEDEERAEILRERDDFPDLMERAGLSSSAEPGM